ncbi:MAG: nickel pincer cofactor biosynthesis protein LarC [Treponema sp.]|jgi:uncharacterized protein (TIGR00299 family) protein|nr:nickel pincer cofactor biosynthesis protein LarC [Treponema sp.]
MKTLHFDCFAGISGDMALGAFADLGVDTALVQAELEKLGLGGWKLDFRRDERCGISGTRAVVTVDDHGRHEHQDHSHNHEHHHGHEHGHHSWKEIRSLIEGAALSEGAKRRALAIFTRIAGAESQVHGIPEEDIAFHEVGALDSIIDIVGTAVCLDLLKPDRITCSEIELGSGTVHCAHGELPVPAPATLILCRGLPVRTGGFQKEMTTPTGAAIAAASADAFTAAGAFRELKTGYGIGTRKLDKPNVLRLSWREEAAESSRGKPWITEELVLIETNIDDMTGEALGFLMESLFAGGALDVTLSPCVMKKSRPGTVVSVLSSGSPDRLDILREILFRRSSAIGFRETPVRRLSLRREEERIGTSLGEAGKKTVFWGEEALGSKFEYEDRARIARDRGISLAGAERLLEGDR